MTAEFQTPQETVEAGLLAAVDGNLQRYLSISEVGITAEDFVSHRQVYLFLQQHLEQYSALPSNVVINARFQWQPAVGEFAYWLAEMRRYSMARKVLSIVQEVYNLSADPEKALSRALERFSILRTATSNHIQASDTGAGERFDKYVARRDYLYSSAKVLGIETGIEAIDETKQGWMPGELIGVYARPGVGKTWWMLWQGAMAWNAGKSILAITPEMPANHLNLRIDVMIGRLLKHPIEYNMLLAGDPTIELDYLYVTQELAKSQRWWTYDSLNGQPIGLGELSALVRLHRPNLLLIDGISLLKADGRKQTWEQMRELSYGIKQLATINDLPVIITHQASNSARGTRKEMAMTGRGDDYNMPSLNDAAFGDSFVQACSTIITMVGDSHARYVQWYSIRKARERGWSRPLAVRMGMAWDPAKGIIIDLGKHGYDEETVGNEARRLLGYDKLH